MFQDRPDVIVGARKDAPLIVGVGDGKMFIASDVLAFIEHTDRTVFLDNQETVEITKERSQDCRDRRERSETQAHPSGLGAV